MKRNNWPIIIVLMLILGLFLVWGIRLKLTPEELVLGEGSREELIKSYLDDQAYLQSRIVFLRKQIEEAQGEISAQTETVNLDVLEGLKRNVGLSDVTGPGVEIFLDDGSGSSKEQGLVQASDIRDIINVLNAGNAVAISVNNQRVITSSPITSVGATILVNNSHLSAPFVISAVGDAEIIMQRLLDEGLLPDLYARARQDGMRFEIASSAQINVPVYNGDLQVDYLNLVK